MQNKDLFQEYLKRRARVLNRFPERKELFQTSSEITVEPFYGDEASVDTLGVPGCYPFTRGVQPTMYRSRFWTMRQYAGFSTAEESNKRYRYLLNSGTTGLSVAFDLPTQMGYDSDSDYALGEVGKVGVAIDTLHDMEVLFDQIPLDKVSTSMTINSTAPILLAMYIAVAKKQGVTSKQISGTIQNDLLKEYIARGTYIYPVEPSLRLITDIFDYCTKEVPRWNTISISGYHIREAGSTAIQEIAFTLADGIAYVEAALNKGLDINSFGKRLSFFLNAHNNFFEEIAKFRVARKMWSQIMKERFGATDEKAMMFRVHTQTAGSTLTAQQPDNNIVRVTLQALAAVMGGTQSLHTNSSDEALALPSEQSVQTALRTQQIIAHESGVADLIDPIGGSYYLEHLTNKMEVEVTTYLDKIDEMGGMVRAINLGFPQKEIQNAAYKTQLSIDSGESVIVGMNRFQGGVATPMPNLLKVDDNIANIQIKTLKEVKAGRNPQMVANALERLNSAARGDENIMPAMVDAVEAYCTLGEISDQLREVFGTYEEKIIL